MSLLIPGYQQLAVEEDRRQAAIHRVDLLPLAFSFSAGDAHVIDTAESALSWADRLHDEAVSMIGIDTEFAFGRPLVPLPNGGAFRDLHSLRPLACTVAVWCAATPTGSPAGGAPLIRLLFDLRRREVYPGLRRLFDLHVPWVAHAGKAELHCLWACDVHPAEHLLIDTYLTAAALNLGRFHPRRRRRDDAAAEEAARARKLEEKRAHVTSLVGQCEHYHLGYPYDTTAKQAMQQRFLGLPAGEPLTPEMVAYAVADAEFALRLHLAQQPDVQRYGLGPHLATVEWPLVATLARMERAGLPVDADRLRQYRELSRRIADEMAARLQEFGIAAGSPKSFLRVMHRAGVLQHFVRRGKYCTSNEVLSEAEPKGVHPAVRLFRLHRYFRRLADDPLLGGGLVSSDGRLRCSLDQLRSVSGRIASARPNLIGLDKRLRPFAAAPPGFKLVELDYCQKEVGVAGAEWQDEALVRQFNLGDSYAGVAQAFYADQLTPEERSMSNKEFKKARPELRGRVKSLVLGILYGRGAGGIAEKFGCTLEHAEAELRRFFDLFPQARDNASRAVRSSLRRGYGLTLSGLRRFVPAGDDRFRNALRNHPVQGGSAAIFKMALGRIGGYFRGSRTQLLLPRHDSILLLTPEETVDEVIAVCKLFMIQAVKEKFPELQPRVDAHVELTWPTEVTLEDFYQHECAIGTGA